MLKKYIGFCKKEKKNKEIKVEYNYGGENLNNKTEYVVNIFKTKCPNQEGCNLKEKCELINKIPDRLEY